MTNFLIMLKGVPEHYFYRPYEGICMHSRNVSGIWQERTAVLPGGKDGFGVYADKNGVVHLICIDGENKLTYAVGRDGIWKKYVLTSLHDDIFVSDMRLYNVGGRLNLLYSALYNGENMLIHCILGDHAKPSTVDTLEAPHFYVYDNKVYYTNAAGELGYVLLSDEKPSGFNRLYPDAHCPTLESFAGKDFLLYTRESRLFINNEEILYDSRMEMPICVKGNGKIYIMWKSGSFIRYITTFNGGVTWSEPMRFMNTGVKASIFTAQQGENFNYYYGYTGEKDITLLGAPDIFTEPADYTLPQPNEFEKLKIMLDMTRQEVMDAKKEIARLNKTIERLK